MFPPEKGFPMKKGISQEGLKLLACITMLIDHIGYEIIYPLYSNAAMVNGADMLGDAMPPEARTLYHIYLLCRCIGRIAFPVFAFLLVEGFRRTRNRKNYALRLALGAIVSEIPYNLMVSGELFWRQQSVMATLLLGFLALIAMEGCRSLAWKPVAAIPFALLAEVFSADYGWAGVALIALFDLSREMYRPNVMRLGGMIVLFHYMSSYVFWIGRFSVPMQVLGALSILFIGAYDGRKLSRSKAAQWAFYLFYPVHMLILWAVGQLLSGVFVVGGVTI